MLPSSVPAQDMTQLISEMKEQLIAQQKIMLDEMKEQLVAQQKTMLDEMKEQFDAAKAELIKPSPPPLVESATADAISQPCSEMEKLVNRVVSLEGAARLLRTENKEFRVENKELRSENERLLAENKRLEAEITQARSHIRTRDRMRESGRLIKSG